MEVKVDEGKNEIKIEITDGDETFANLLISKLNETKGVDFASYKREHPLSNKIFLVVRGENLKKAIVSAVDLIKEDIAAVRKYLPAKEAKPVKAKKEAKPKAEKAEKTTKKAAVKKTKTKSKK